MVRFNDADDFFETAAAGGNAMRLKDIKGIGPKTANKINNVREIQGTDDVKEMSADELSDKAGISRSRASKAIKGLGGNPAVSKRSGSTGTVSAAGIQQAQGDFMVGFSELDKARARNDAMSRSETAVRVDERRRAPVTTDYEKWKNAPGEWDFPGVDTPTQEPNLLPKDVKAGNPETTDFKARDEREREQKAQSYPRTKPSASGKENYILETGEDRIPASEMSATGMGVSDADTFTSALDVPASPEEVFEGVGSGHLFGERAPVNEEAPPEQALRKQSGSESFVDELRKTREDIGDTAANAKYWEQRVREFEDESMTVDFDEVTSIAGQTVVELGDFFEDDPGGVDAVVTGLADRGAPIKSVEGTSRIRIDASDRPRPIPYQEREKTISGRFVKEE